MLLDVLTASVLGGILCLDRLFVQAALSRPIVAGALIGLILGEPRSGLLTGALVELFWVDQFQIGAYIPPNDSVAAIVITAGTVISGKALGGISKELVATAALLFIPLGILGRQMDIAIMRANDGLSRRALSDAVNGDLAGVEKKQLCGLAGYFLASVGFLAVFTLVAEGTLLWVYPAIPEKVFPALKYVYSFLPLIGIAVALNTIKLKGMVPVFCAVFLAVAVLLDLA